MKKPTSLEMNLLRRMNIGDIPKRSAAKSPDRVVLIYQDRKITLREMNDNCCRFAHYYQKMGVKRGDRVAFITHNCLQYLYSWLGLAKIGGVITPLNFMLKGPEVEFIIKNAEPKYFFVEDVLIPQVGDAASHVKGVKMGYIPIWGTEKPAGWINLDDAYDPSLSKEEPLVEVDDDDTATLLYTSGTEALPKGVMTTHGNYFMTMMSGLADLNVSQEDVVLLSIPLFHVAGKYLFLESVHIGAKVVLEYTPNPVEILELTQKEKATYWVYPPALYQIMPSMPNFASYDLSSLKKCIAQGSLMPVVLLEKWKQILPRAEWRNYYGMTESSPLGSTLHPQDFERKIKTIGIPHTGVEIRILDDEDRELPAGEVGEIAMRGPCIMKGYFRNEEKTAEAFRSGWLHTGDLGMFDEEGFLYFVDRKKDMIKTGGENVSSQEVEGVLYKYDKVMQAAVIGTPHEYWVEAVTAVIVPRPGMEITEEEIITYCKNNLAGYKVPKKVIIMAQMPVSPTGKVLKRLLREQLVKDE